MSEGQLPNLAKYEYGDYFKGKRIGSIPLSQENRKEIKIIKPFIA